MHSKRFETLTKGTKGTPKERNQGQNERVERFV